MSAFNSAIWSGRRDTEEGAGPWRWHETVKPWGGSEADAIVLLGLACDAGVRRNHGRAGAAEGPDALRTALANLPLHAPLAVRDAGNVGGSAQGDELELLQRNYAAQIAQILRSGSRPIGLGGGHEIAWGSWCGLIDSLGKETNKKRIGIINFDAHFDLRAGALASSGTPFRQIAEQCQASGRPFDYLCLGVSRFANTRALFERAAALGVTYLLDEQLVAASLDECRHSLAAFMKPLDALYLTFCLDVLPANVAPGVSAPAARGVALEVIEPLLDQVLASGLVSLADIAELNPRFDIDQRTARVAARVLARIAESMRHSG